MPTLRPFEPGEFITNPDGSKSTERTFSFTIGDQVIVVPSLFMGPEGPVDLQDNPKAALDTALEFERTTGKKFPHFKSIGEADAFSRNRSSGGGATHKSLAR